MRLPTVGQFKFQMSTLARQYQQIQSLQIQASSGKKLQRASDNPNLANRIHAIENQVQIQKTYELNATLAETRTNTAVSRVEEALHLTGQVQQLIDRARTGTTSAEDKQNIAEQLASYQNSLLVIANTQDGQGEYIFSGLSAQNPAYQSDGTHFYYNGNQTPLEIPISSVQNIIYNEAGSHIFGHMRTGNGTFTVSADFQNNQGTGVVQATQALGNYEVDTYTIQFSKNANGELVYEVSGQNSGPLIPTPPDDPPLYHPGNSITFNGVNITFSGTPNAGDVFEVKPSAPENVFNTLQNLIDTVRLPTETPKEKADFQQKMGEHSASFEQVIDHMQLRLNELGGRSKTIENQKQFSEKTLMEQRLLIGQLGDADMSQVIGDLSQRLASIEVTQQSYLRIQETFFSLLSRWNG